MLRNLMRQPLFMIGFTIVFLLLIASIITGIIYHGHIPHVYTVYKNHDLIGGAPFKPALVPPLGTDSAGNLLLQEMLMGAKYTIGIAAVVAFLRVCLSLFAGVFFQRYLMKANFYFSGIIDCFHYVPISLVCYILLSGVLLSVTGPGFTHHFATSYTSRVFFELIMLTILAVPGLMLFFANETESIYKKEFIRSVELLGGKKNYILRRHLLPLLGPKLLLTFIEQMVQTLILLIHLGLFKLMFGGTYVFALAMGASDRYQSQSGEWSGLIGSSFDYLFIDPRIMFIPLIGFAILILSLNFMLDGLKQAFEKRHSGMKPHANKDLKNSLNERPLSDESFEKVHKSA